jgi:hypothetical protein
MHKRFLATAALAMLWTAPAGAPVLCPDQAGRYTPEHCDLILPIARHPRAVECNYIAALAGRADPICIEYIAGEDARAARLGAAMACLERPPEAVDGCSSSCARSRPTRESLRRRRGRARGREEASDVEEAGKRLRRAKAELRELEEA